MLMVIALFSSLALLVEAAPSRAQSLEQLVAGAKKEGEVTLVASASTFGGKKGFAELEAGFNKRFGLKHKVNLAPGPSFPQVAARILTEIKSGAKASTDLYLGSDGTMSDMSREKALQKVHDSIREGEGFAAPLRESKTCDAIVVNMIDVGEETGELDTMLMKIADNYDEEVEVLVESLVSLLEPIMIVVLGGIIGFIVIALFLPLIQLITKLSG